MQHTTSFKPHHLPLLIASIALAAPSFSQASSTDEHWYAGVMGGLASQSDQSLAFSSGANRENGTLPLDSGNLVGGRVGRAFGNGWRLEGEFAYQGMDSKGPVFPPRAPPSQAPQGAGDYASTSFAVNALYDFNLTGSEKATTYVGFGLVYLTEVDLDIGSGSAGRNYSGSGSGAQALFGARYDVADAWTIDVGLRYLRATGLSLDQENGAGRIRADYTPWAITIGIDRRF
jgi:opacity protein-like surface antigen